MNLWTRAKLQFLRRWPFWSILFTLGVICFWPVFRYSIDDYPPLTKSDLLASKGDSPKDFSRDQYFPSDPEVHCSLRVHRWSWEEEAAF